MGKNQPTRFQKHKVDLGFSLEMSRSLKKELSSCIRGCPKYNDLLLTCGEIIHDPKINNCYPQNLHVYKHKVKVNLIDIVNLDVTSDTIFNLCNIPYNSRDSTIYS